MLPDSSDTSSGSAPASSSACHGRSSSTCSTPSVARTATLIPSSSPAMSPPLPGAPAAHTPAHYGSLVSVPPRPPVQRAVEHPLVGRLLAGRLVAGARAQDGLRVAAAL